MKILLSMAIILTLSSCAFFSKRLDNSAAIKKYENKMRSIASLGNGKLQLPKGYKLHKASLTTVGPDGDVILFYKDKNEIIIKECERYSVINNKLDCKSNSQPVRVSVSSFKNKLKLALRVQNFDILGQQEAQQLKDYRKGLSEKSIKGLVQYRDDLHKRLSQIEKFANAYGIENANTEELSDLKAKLYSLDEDIKKGQELSVLVKSLNASINKLVDKVIGSSKMNTMSYSKDKTGIEYSVLKSYARHYLAQAAFVPVKVGKFTMGSPASEKGRFDNEAQEEIELKEDFEIGATEVTQLQWVVVMGSNPSKHKKEFYCPKSYMEIDGVSLCYDFPVENVSWNDAQDYILEYEKRAKDNFTYRLPTEAEWEFAARAGTTTAYSFGDNPSELGDYAWFKGNSGDQTRAVATRKPNPLNIHDMHGNVAEWSSERYRRGGSYFEREAYLRSAYRKSAYMPSHGWWSVGFYLAKVVTLNYDLTSHGWWDVGFRLVRTPKTTK